jgi:hypothetical protein
MRGIFMRGIFMRGQAGLNIRRVVYGQSVTQGHVTRGRRLKRGCRVVRYVEQTRHAVSISRPIPACGWTALRAVPM